jgi:hypothetical protein
MVRAALLPFVETVTSLRDYIDLSQMPAEPYDAD